MDRPPAYPSPIVKQPALRGATPQSRDQQSGREGSIAPPRPAVRNWIRILLVLLTLIAFSPVLWAQFTNWDDNETISHNPRLNPPSLDALRFYWTHPFMDLFVPVTQTVWVGLAWVATALPRAARGEPSPVVFHSANLVLHILSSVVVFEILRRLLRCTWPAAGAAIFALHPLQVEPVAWASGLKDVLCGLLSLLAVWQYIAAAQASEAQPDAAEVAPIANGPGNPGAIRRWVQIGYVAYMLSTIFFVAAMLAKPSAIGLPLAVVALDRIMLHRRWSEIARMILPWAVLAAPVAIWAHMAQPANLQDLPPAMYLRPLIAGHALAFYLMKIIAPVQLAVDYGWTPAAALRQWAYFAWIVPLACAVILWMTRKRIPGLAAGGAFFVLALLPMLGFVTFDFQAFSTVADHYLYVPMLGIGLIAGSMLARWEIQASKYTKKKCVAGVIVLVLAMMALTFRQALYWHDIDTLFNHTLAVNPQSWTAHNNLASDALERGDANTAQAEAEKSLQINPRHAQAMISLALARGRLGDSAGQLKFFEQAVQTVPDNPRLLGQVGGAEAQAGRLVLAERMLRYAVQLDPHATQARKNLGTLLLQEGNDERSAAKLRESVEQLQLALQDDNRDARVHTLLGLALADLGRNPEAIPHFQTALQLDPNDRMAQSCLEQIRAAQK